jgi:hypothetical protein
MIKQFKLVALTLNKGMAYDGIRSPILRTESGVFLLVGYRLVTMMQTVYSG